MHNILLTVCVVVISAAFGFWLEYRRTKKEALKSIPTKEPNGQ